MKNLKLIQPQFADYELIDSGDGRKLERFGSIVTARPEPQAIWRRAMSQKEWADLADAVFERDGKSDERGRWQLKPGTPERWTIGYDYDGSRVLGGGEAPDNGGNALGDRPLEGEAPYGGRPLGSAGNISGGEVIRGLIGGLHLRIRLALTGFKHVGVFPEQAANWNFIYDSVRSLATGTGFATGGGADSGMNSGADFSAGLRADLGVDAGLGVNLNAGSGIAPRVPRVLNLFAYTGGATLAARAAGAVVTHVDSVKQTVSWARDNLTLSGLDSTGEDNSGRKADCGDQDRDRNGGGGEVCGDTRGRVRGEARGGVRWIVDDALKFVQREVRRGSLYDGIILDPPAYGRGPDGEKWVLEDALDRMLESCAALLAPRGFLVLNLYSMGLSALVAQTIVHQHFEVPVIPCANLAEEVLRGLPGRPDWVPGGFSGMPDGVPGGLSGGPDVALGRGSGRPDRALENLSRGLDVPLECRLGVPIGEQMGELFFTDRASRALPLGVYYRFRR